MTDVADIARTVFGWTSLRPGLTRGIATLLAGGDLLAVMPTGYGKSAIYKVAGAVLDGCTVVVSPLIALQADQIAGIRERSTAPGAVALNSTLSDTETELAWTDLRSGAARYVFLAPEQLAKEEVVAGLEDLPVALFVVDEAHCVSSWGHDFRPDYLRLGEVADRLGRPPIVALTATGSPPVRAEIVERLGLHQPVVLTRGFDRPNIELTVVRHESDNAKRESVLDQVRSLPKPGLLYVATRRDTEEYAAQLAESDLVVTAYHGGLTAAQRAKVHDQFRDNRFDVVVATSAFGMGIDKPNIRFVVHAAIPESVDSYYQEIGRSGRDGSPATAVLHYRAEDLGLRAFFNSGTPDREDLLRCYAALREHPATRVEIARSTDLPPRRVTGLLNLLQEAGAVSHDGRMFSAIAAAGTTAAIAADQAADRALEAAASRRRIDDSRIAMMRGYAETTECRRHYLLGYFGEESPERCDNCDYCLADPGALRRSSDSVERFPPQSRVHHPEWGDGTVLRADDDRITVFFEKDGYRVLSRAAIEDRQLLTPVP